jgi:hypothetical protein
MPRDDHCGSGRHEPIDGGPFRQSTSNRLRPGPAVRPRASSTDPLIAGTSENILLRNKARQVGFNKTDQKACDLSAYLDHSAGRKRNLSS